MQIEWAKGVWATSYGLGPFHPAIRNGQDLYYWPNITHETEDLARQWAKEVLDSCVLEANYRTEDWNVVEVLRY